jgi:hypothetical protein
MLSLHGCFVEMKTTLPAESSVGIKIFAESKYFDGPANIVYVRENVGMGLAFQEVSLGNGNVVREWLQPGQRIDELDRNIRRLLEFLARICIHFHQSVSTPTVSITMLAHEPRISVIARVHQSGLVLRPLHFPLPSRQAR